MSINVVVSSTAAGVSVSGGTAVGITLSGGIGPAGFLVAPGTATNAFGTFQLKAGEGITISTSAAQFEIASYGTTAVSSFAPVQSVAGRTGAITLQAADITAGTFSVARIPTIGYTALSGVPTTLAPAAHTHSIADISGYQSLPDQAGKNGALVTDGTAAAWATRYSVVDPVLIEGAGMVLTRDTAAGSITVAFSGNTSGVVVSSATPQPLGTASAGKSGDASRADHVHALPTVAAISAASAIHTHAAADVTSGTFDVARIPTIGYTALSGVPATFTPSAHTHSTSDITGYTLTRINGLSGTLTLAGGSNVTVTTAGSTITVATSNAGGIGANDAVDGGTYTGTAFSGISIQGQPADVTVTATSTVGGWNSIAAWSPLPRLYNAGDDFSSSVETIAAGAGRYMAIYTEENVFYNYSGSGSARIFSKRLYDSADGINWTAIGSRIDSPPWYPSVQQNPYSDATAAFLLYDGSRWIVAMLQLQNAGGNYLNYGMVLRTISGSAVSAPIAAPQPAFGFLAFPSMVFFNGTYLYAGTDGSSFVFRSADLTNWSSQNAATLPAYATASPTNGVLAATQNCVVYVVQTNNQGKIAYASTDGETWQSPVVASSGYSSPLSLAASSSQFVLASGGTGLKISSNGTSWTSVTAPRTVSRVFWANDRFIGLDSASTYEYVYSFNGTNWYVGSLGTSVARRFAVGNGSTTIVGGDSGGSVSSFTSSSASATYTVSATAVNAGAISYQWQASSDGGSTYFSINGATSATLSLSGLTTADTGKRYRCMMTASGAATTYSRAATLTVN